MPNVLPPPPASSSGPPGQAAQLKGAQANARLTALTKGGGVLVPKVAGAPGSEPTTSALYRVAYQQNANRTYDGGRRTKRRKSKRNRKSKKYRKKSRR